MDKNLEKIVHRVVCTQVDNNNEYYYQKIILCMLDLSYLFIDTAPQNVVNSIELARNYWSEYWVGDNLPTDEIDLEYGKLSKYIDKKPNAHDLLCARAARFLLRKFDSEAIDYNCDIFPIYIDYLLKIGVSSLKIVDSINKYFD